MSMLLAIILEFLETLVPLFFWIVVITFGTVLREARLAHSRLFRNILVIQKDNTYCF